MKRAISATRDLESNFRAQDRRDFIFLRNCFLVIASIIVIRILMEPVSVSVAVLSTAMAIVCKLNMSSLMFSTQLG